jgi:hypothetical protein
MADYNNGGQQERRKGALDNRRLTLQALDKNADGKYSSWVWGFRKNMPTITIWTNEEADKQSQHKGKISAEMDIALIYFLCEEILRAIEEPGEYKASVNLKGFKFFGAGKRSDEPMLLSSIFVGKGADGVIWLSVTAKDRPRYRFGFVPPEAFNDFVDGNGNPADRGKVSQIYARGYVKLLQQLYATYAYHEFTEPPPKKQGGGGYGGGNGGGGYNNGGGGGYGGGNGGGQRQQSNYSDMDNDVPY